MGVDMGHLSVAAMVVGIGICICKIFVYGWSSISSTVAVGVIAAVVGGVVVVVKPGSIVFEKR